MRDIGRPVLVVRSAYGSGPAKEYCIGDSINHHGSPAPAQDEPHQSGKRNRVQGQACSDAHPGGSRQLIGEGEICPPREENDENGK